MFRYSKLEQLGLPEKVVPRTRGVVEEIDRISLSCLDGYFYLKVPDRLPFWWWVRNLKGSTTVSSYQSSKPPPVSQILGTSFLHSSHHHEGS